MPEPVPALAAIDVSLSYSTTIRALDRVSVSIGCGEVVAIIGPNGSGKSSLLRAMAGLRAVDSGEVRVDGRPLQSLVPLERARKIAVVPQSLETPTGFSVEDFVMMGRYAHLTGWRLFGKHDRDVAHECLRRVDAFQFLDRSMNEMSGGERQRVLFARALAQEASLVLLDEPTSALDLKHQMMVYELIHELPRRDGKTVVVVTHDLNLASQFADRLVLLRNGRVEAQGAPAEVLRPEVLKSVYETDLAYGQFDDALRDGARPWVLPWARKRRDK